jgi:squalene/oxidosqualene cyclase-like protein
MSTTPCEGDQTLDAADRCMRRALDNLARLQLPQGSWAGDYGGPMFLLPMYVALCYISRQEIDAYRRDRMLEYVFNVQNEDGSIGLHAWGEGCMFTTALCYAALRLLGAPRDDARVQRMRGWIHANGTPLGAAPWGKFTLALLNVYDWRGVDPITPELWLLPYAIPFHPGRMWCHCRQVYLPMAWLYGRRFSVSVDALIAALREELYDAPYESIRFEEHRETISSTDRLRATSSVLRAANRALAVYERAPLARLREGIRRRSLAKLYRHICYEDAVTSAIALGPVNAVLNTLCHHVECPGGDDFNRGFATLSGYLWDGHDGMKMQGLISTELWDTAFTVQAMLATPHWRGYAETMSRAHAYIRDNQIIEDVPQRRDHYRHLSRGGWPFTKRAHGWPVTDCTSEGLKCALALEPSEREPVPEGLLRDAVRLLLSFQNDDGGWASYERQRSGRWIELLNPSQVFDDIMVDYSTVECTSACLQALQRAKVRFPGEIDRSIDAAVRRGVRFLRSRQRADGSFEAAWGVCFTYGTWFGVTGLLDAGVPRSDDSVRRACSFLLAHQRPDGAWGEHFKSCTERRYVEHPRGQVVMTSWALMTLVRAGCEDRGAMARAARFLSDAQEADGSWAREAVAGVFNRTCMINYDNYRHYFPTWALGEWSAFERAEGRAIGRDRQTT